MDRNTLLGDVPTSIALIGNHLPRHCGIATFTTDLLNALCSEAPDIKWWAMVMNDIPEGYPYPKRVRFELDYKKIPDYRLAADFLNMNQVEVVSLQHEFGIFGGENGRHILELIDNLRMPVITTLHTVLEEPDTVQKKTLEDIGSISGRLIVMSKKAEAILKGTYSIPEEKITLIHHGIPDVPFVDPNFFKDQFGVEGKKVILTFGLLSSGKGIEYMIDALPEIVKNNPDTRYIVLGATHPNVKRAEGESYRLSLQRRARDLGVEKYLIFHNRFVDLKELTEFLGATDVYVTPYLNRDQIVSGTLAYALGTGKATISTPYWYAEEMLSDRRGRIVPFHDSEALAEQINDLLGNEVERHAMRKRAYTFCRNMIWKKVARRYMEIFAEVKHERESRPKLTFLTKTLDAMPPELPQPNLNHLKLLTDDVGILQHAKFIVPDRSHGYCTDDNARALIVVLLAQETISSRAQLNNLACRYLSFLNHALNGSNGYFRNFMGFDRRWLEASGSEDSHGRAMWGLGTAIAFSRSENLTGNALNLFERALPSMFSFSSPRAIAFGLVGIHAYLRKFSGDSEVRRLRAHLADNLFKIYQNNASDDWPWIEDTVTYANGKIPQALLLSGQWLQRGDMIDAGLRSLEWLVRIQTDPSGHFIPIGNRGWFTRNRERARFDQQPLEAQNMIEVCIEAYHVTHDRKWIEVARRAFEWFLGRNDLNALLYDYTTGGCRDGLTADGPNLNQGAESTLAWLLSLLNFHHLMDSEAGVKHPAESGKEKHEKKANNND